jgi:alpha-methylacyl-CoA racemase
VRPLRDLFLLDLSTLLPGPIATLLLAEAGMDVVKIERPLLDEAFLQAQRGASGGCSPTPIAPHFRRAYERHLTAPSLGAHNRELGPIAKRSVHLVPQSQ